MTILLIVVGLGIWIGLALRWQKKRTAEELDLQHEYAGWEIFITARDRGVLALDVAGSKIAIGPIGKLTEWNLGLLSSVEIEKNGQSALVTNRGSQAVGAVVGGILLGPLGLLVGSVTGSKRQNERVNQLALKIVLDDPKRPVHRIVFFKTGGKGAKTDNALMIASAQRLEHFHALLANVLKAQAALPKPVLSEQPATLPTQPAIANGRIEERIAALWQLKVDGALTAEEFAKQKSLLLGGGEKAVV